MRTEDLIAALTADQMVPALPLGRTLMLASACGAAMASVVFFIVVGVRTDIAQAAETARFLLKFVLTLGVTIPAIGLVIRLARPAAPIGIWAWAFAVVPALLLVSVGAELVTVPASAWVTTLVGANWWKCLTVIPMLSIPPLACVLLALRHGAPTSPGFAGTVAGLLSAGIAATLYASNCTDDSPLFVATWYPIAIGIVALAGNRVGRWLLRW